MTIVSITFFRVIKIPNNFYRVIFFSLIILLLSLHFTIKTINKTLAPGGGVHHSLYRDPLTRHKLRFMQLKNLRQHFEITKTVKRLSNWNKHQNPYNIPFNPLDCLKYWQILDERKLLRYNLQAAMLVLRIGSGYLAMFKWRFIRVG